jgi:phosphopantetheinyl transferase (holo-ACP synthase)
VRSDPLGKPGIIFSARGRQVCSALGVGDGHLTLSDEGGLVVAVAILMKSNA